MGYYVYVSVEIHNSVKENSFVLMKLDQMEKVFHPNLEQKFSTFLSYVPPITSSKNLGPTMRETKSPLFHEGHLYVYVGSVFIFIFNSTC